jgi:peptide subunit release factor 1 (eRF1)
MITREQFRELAQLEDQHSCALSFYFQPTPPRNKAHKEEAILVKDLAREALRSLETKSSESRSNGKCESARADLDRIVRLSQDLRGNGSHAKAVFACSAQNFWREYDLPAQLASTQLFIDRHFHLKPLARLLGAFPSLGIVLVDRHRARLFDLRLGELTEREGFFHPLSRRGRSDGFAGYDGGHAERRVADEARQHFKHVAEFLKEAIDKGMFEKWILGCQDTHWPQFEAQLHPYVSQRLLGRFSADVVHVGREEIRSEAERIFTGSQNKRCADALRETIEQARSNGRGVTGLRRVLHALELGEVQTLLLGDNYSSQAVECAGCGHLDAHLVHYCPACGRATRTVVDIAEAILPWVIRRDIELFYVKDDAEFDKVGNIAALLRFRAGADAAMRPIAAKSADHPPSPRARLVGRYRGIASGA